MNELLAERPAFAFTPALRRASDGNIKPPYGYACQNINVGQYTDNSSRETTILFPRGRAPFGQHQESRPLRRVIVSYSRPIRFVGLDSEHAQRSVNWCWTFPGIAILDADQKERGLWGREWTNYLFLYILNDELRVYCV